MGVMLLFSLSDLGMLFSELHGAMTIDHLAPSRAPLKRKTPRTSTPSHRLFHTHTHPAAHRESDKMATEEQLECCDYFEECVFSFTERDFWGLLSSLLPSPHRTTLTSDCGVMATTMRMEIDFTERTCVCFLYVAHPARRVTIYF